MIVDPELVRKLDEMVREHLQDLSDVYFKWLLISTAVVVLGVILEIFEVIDDLRVWHRSRRESTHASDKPKTEVVLPSTLGLILVILGVAGEGVFEYFAAQADGTIRAFDNILIVDTERQTAEIYERAAIAMAEAGRAEERAGEAEERALAASNKTDREALQREKLGEEVGPRKLTTGQQEDIRKACVTESSFSPANRINVQSYGMDGEGTALATQISAALAEGRIYNNLDAGSFIQTGEVDFGVLISGPPEQEKFMDCLASALVNIGKLHSVTVNGARHVGNAMTTDKVVSFGKTRMTGGGSIRPGGPLPPGSPVSILVATRPTGAVTQ
jgi:hypothetical protein